ncbi:hypothetical protein MDAP_000203 [Mitosporidium daphniae]|uniref:UDP-glucose 4-epimerase n=1 Tax=Mitosporidium daphniae TaxID=1485682 RepID=A0A098VTE0_9MICR|nr:UDP-glucose 4-epimerase [Mitosporidium daphniae]KGG50971.1 UDP-glucose 4-epimerase [Mitosporidium daphniae]|eukprot:XP_013237419.1 UDP-glucose 4-epimerase [Mitosporidium daphniae]
MRTAILVTGAAGYIGSHLCVKLLQAGHFLIALDNLVNSKKDDLDFLLLSLSDTKILTIFHVAGYKSVPESFSSPLLYYHNNVSSIINLLASFSKYKQAYSRNDDATFIFSSSAAVYGPNGQQNAELSESSPIDPISPYGRSKAMCEAILSDYASSSSFPFKVVSLRYFNPIGAHPKDYIHIEDLVSGHVSAMEKAPSLSKDFSAFNLGTGIGYTVFEIGPRRLGDLDTLVADPSLAENVLGWKASKNLVDMCVDHWNWELKLLASMANVE